MPLHELRRTMLRESPANPRKTFDPVKLHELAENIKQHGVLEPLLARPLNLDVWHATGLSGLEEAGEPLEVVAGARRLRASEIAGLPAVPVIVRVLSDEAAEIIMLSENLHRNDLSPMEEADAFVRLVHLHQVDIADVAAKAGRSRQYVAQRLRLAALPDGARAALAEGRLSIGVATTLAALPASSLGAATTKALELVDNSWPTESIIRELRGQWTLKLGSAVWPLDDASLGAVACSVCPSRSNAQLSLIAEGADLDTCLDRACYEGKRATWWERRASQAKSAGMGIAKTEEVFKHGYLNHQKYTRLDDKCWEDPKSRTYGQLLEGTKAPRLLVKQPDGTPTEVIVIADAKRALVEAGHKFAKTFGPREKTPVEKRLEEQARVDAETEKRMLTAILVEMSREKPAQYSLPFWRLLAKCVCAGTYYEVQNRLVHRRNLLVASPEPVKGKKPARPANIEAQELINRAIDGYQIAECRSIIVEALICRGTPFTNDHEDDTLLDFFAKLWGVSRMVEEKRVRAEFAKPAPKPAPKTSTKAPAKAPAKKGGAR
jgi:ParB/RepB/Spo0J family partition protein